MRRRNTVVEMEMSIVRHYNFDCFCYQFCLDEILAPPSSAPIPTTATTASAATASTTAHRVVDKRMIDAVTYEALLLEKAKLDAEAAHLIEERECFKIRRELLQIELFEKRRSFEEVRGMTEDDF